MTYCKYCGADLPPNKQVRDNKQIDIMQWDKLEKIEEVLGADGVVATDKEAIFSMKDENFMYMLIKIERK